MSTKSKILVTGGAGYIGSHTILELIASGTFEIVSLDNFSNSSPDTFSRIKKITGKDIVNYAVDLCDKTALKKIFDTEKNISGIIHFAAFKSVPESVEDPSRYYANNLYSLLNILGCAKEYNTGCFLFSSSCSVYGNISQLPVKEETPMGIAESPYAYTKQVGERILSDFCKAEPSVRAISLRYFNPVGAHESGLIGEFPIHAPNNLVPVITQTAIGKIRQMTVFGKDYDTRDGSCVRDYVHVMDIAAAHVKAMQHLLERRGKTNYSVFNLGTGEGISVLEAIAAFEKISGLRLNYTVGPRRPGDVVAIYSDTSKVKKELGWETRYSLDEMMMTAWKWEQHLQKASL